MDSDLSLIDISGKEEEDDSLVHQIPSHDIIDFAISPLHLPISHSSSSFSSTLSVTKTNEDSKGLGSSTSYSNKENVNTTDNKSGTPNLSIQPQKMKRGKKGGGYNLRKSLAWDRAFITEEGVLDSMELSLITGIPGELNGDGLSVTNEHGTDLNSNNVGGFLNLEKPKEDSLKELPSGNLNERNAASSPIFKQDSLSRSNLACGSKPSQRIPPRNDVSKNALKGRVTSSPMAPASQKRLLNMGTTKVMMRNSKIPKLPVSRQDTCLPPVTDSKIPKFPVSKQDTCLPSITASHTGANGSGLKSNRISQSAQKNVISKVSFNIKNASTAPKVSSECTSKSSKPSAENGKKDMAIPSLDMNLSTNHPAQHTTNCSILSEMTSNKGSSTGGTDVIKSIDKISRTTVSSHHICVSVDSNKKTLQSQGAKPSGLRMPSPSLRFFSEPKVSVSNVSSKNNTTASKLLKSSIPTSKNLKAANHVDDLKPAQLLSGVVNLDATGKSGVSSQMIDKCSTSSILDPTTACMVAQDEDYQQEGKVQVPPGANTLKQMNNEQSRSQVLDVSSEFHTHHVPTSLKYEYDDRMNEKMVLSHLESAEATHKTSILSEIGDATISKSSFESCREMQLNFASETTREVQPELVEHTSPGMNDEVMPGFQANSRSCNSLSLAADSGTLSSILYDNKPSEKSNICSFNHIVDEGSMDLHTDGGTLLPAGASSLKLKETDPVVLVCDDRDVVVEKSDGDQLCSSFDNVETSCCTERSIECNESIRVYYQQQPHVDNEEGDIIVDECLEAQSDVRDKDYHLLMPDDIFFNDKDYSLKSKNFDNKGISNVSPEVQARREQVNNEEGDTIVDDKLPTMNVNGYLEGQGDVMVKDYQLLAPRDFFCKDQEVSLKSNSFDNKDISNVSPKVQAHRRFVNDEGDIIADKKSPTMDAEECLEAQGDVRGNDYQLLASDDFFFKETEFSLKSKNFDYKGISNVSPDVQTHRGHVNNEEGEMIVDKNLATMNVAECLEAQCDVRGKDYQRLTSGDFFFKDKEFLSKSKNVEYKDNSNVCLEVQAHKRHGLMGRSSQSSFLEPTDESGVQVDRTFTTSEHELQSQLCEHEIVDSYAFDLCALASDTQWIEGTVDANNEEKHASTNELPEKEQMTQSIEPDLTVSILLGQITPSKNQEGHAGIIDDRYKVCSSSAEVDQTDSLTLLSSSGKESMDQTSNLEFHSSSMESEDQVASPPVAVSETEKSYSSDDRDGLQPRDELMTATLEEHIEYNKCESSISPREPETRIFQDVDGISGENICYKKEIDCMYKEDTNSKLIKSEDGEKLKRPALNVVPFSDEWLAAIEAAGEEILTMKTGAVQNSPPDKSIPEPSPWSPVKKKNNQDIGPFDCTKYRNTQRSSE